MPFKLVNYEFNNDTIFGRVAEAEYNLVKHCVKVRKHKGLTVEDIMSKTGLTKKQIYKIEKVDESPKVEELLLYLEAIGMSLKLESK